MSPSGIPLIKQAIDEIWSDGNVDLADALFTPDYVNHGGLIPDLIRGPEGIKFAVVLAWHAFPELRISVDLLLVDEQMVTVRWVATGIGTGDLSRSGICAGPDRVSGLTTIRLLGDRIAESWTRWETGVTSQPLAWGVSPGEHISNVVA